MHKKTTSDWVVNLMSYSLISLLCVTVLIPLWNLFVVSVSPVATDAMTFRFWPKAFDWKAWQGIITSEFIWRSFYNTIFRVVLGTAIAIIMTVLTAYPLSKKMLPFRKLFLIMVLFTMLFSGGLIPSYLLVVNMGLRNTIWSLVLPIAVSPFNVIIMKNFFAALPKSLEESATIDGANDLIVLFKIAIPMSMPVIATITLWLVVTHYNAWFDVVLYITERSRYVLQIVLREYQASKDPATMNLGTTEVVTMTPESIRAATTLFVMVPIIMVYTFLQKYFIKGISLGAIKE
ncbi:MAG: carbohydrate ABC transporter permease [Firmicutes bacterium]|nr:carbohydrate ABC transporter permease [Bacillota bacterium]